MSEEKCSAVKAYLQKIRLYDAHINNKLAEKRRLFEMATSITATLRDDVVSGTGAKDRVGDIASKLADIEMEIDRAVDAFVDKKREVQEHIDKLQNPDHVKLLYKRYVEYLSFEQIACDLNFSYRHTTRLHGRALQAIERVLVEKGVL